MSRRTFAGPGTLAARAVAMSGPLWQAARATGRHPADPGPYGSLGAPDADGVAVPEGFACRVVARSGFRVGGVVWHTAPDGGACFRDEDGWIYVSNSEASLLGGVSAARFGPDGAVRSAYRILSGTNFNGAGCATPWNTWLSCEEILCGRVFECDPYGSSAAMPRLAMGCFKHDAVACDPDQRVVYLTEDEPDGCFYRFVPEDWGDLTTGTLEVLVGAPGATGPVSWQRIPNPAALVEPTRDQIDGARHFDGGAGCHYADGVCHFTTTGDGRVWAYDAVNQRIEEAHGIGGLISRLPGDLFVARDDMGIDVVTGEGSAAPFLRITGQDGSEITGPAFSPDGRRLYFSSRLGSTYEVTGPFRG